MAAPTSSNEQKQHDHQTIHYLRHAALSRARSPLARRAASACARSPCRETGNPTASCRTYHVSGAVPFVLAILAVALTGSAGAADP